MDVVPSLDRVKTCIQLQRHTVQAPLAVSFSLAHMLTPPAAGQEYSTMPEAQGNCGLSSQCIKSYI